MSNKPKSPESKDTKAAAEAFDGSSITNELHTEVPPENYLHKSFEYAVIKWSVNNFSYNNERKFSLRSSTFDLHAAVPTSWCLGITWSKNDALEVHLIRMGANPVHEIIVSGRVGFINAGDHQFRWQCEFYVINTETGLYFSNVTDILRHNFCSFKIVFQLFFYKDFELEPFEYSLNTAQAMNILKPKNQEETSIPITVVSNGGYAYTIDKRICDKSPVLTQKITESENNIVSLPFDAEVTFQCLAYLYLKRLDYIVDVQTASSLDLAAKFLKMQDLEKCISPTEIDIFSNAGGEGLEIRSKVPEYKLKANSYYQLHATPEVSCRLELKETEKDIKAIVTIHKCDRELDLNFKIFVFNSEEGELISIEESLFAHTGVTSLIQKPLINKDSRGVYKSNYLPDNLLSVQWNLCHSDMRFKNEITKITRSSTQTASGLTDPMAGLSISVNNIVIIAGDMKFTVHKEILESRSESFMELLSGKNECEVTVPDMPGELMELILKFIYSGQLYTSDWETMHRLYLKLSEFQVYFLPLICEHFFLCNLNPDNWQKLLKRAIKSKNLTFVKNIVNVICEQETISQSEEWKAKQSERKFRKAVSKLFKNSGLSISFD